MIAASTAAVPTSGSSQFNPLTAFRPHPPIGRQNHRPVTKAPVEMGVVLSTLVDPFANDVFVAKLSADGSRLLYSTIVCGQGDDISTGIAVDTSGNAYVGGTTASSDFPTVNPLQDRFRGGPVGLTGFVFKLAADGSGLVFSTYLGGSTNDTIQALAIDAERNIYVTGETSSQDFPTTAGVVQELAGNRHCIQTCSDAFVTKIDATGLALVYSTYLSGELDDAGMGITVDNLGQADRRYDGVALLSDPERHSDDQSRSSRCIRRGVEPGCDPPSLWYVSRG